MKKKGSRKMKGGGLTDLLSAASAGTPFDISKMNDVVKAVGAVSDSLKNAPALIQAAQDQIKTDVKTVVNKQVAAATADITAKAVDAATQAVGSVPPGILAPGIIPPILNPAGKNNSGNAPANNSGNAPANNSGNAPANNSYENAPANNSYENAAENNSSSENFEGGSYKKRNIPCKCVCKCLKNKTRRRRPRQSKVKRRHTRRR